MKRGLVWGFVRLGSTKNMSRKQDAPAEQREGAGVRKAFPGGGTLDACLGLGEGSKSKFFQTLVEKYSLQCELFKRAVRLCHHTTPANGQIWKKKDRANSSLLEIFGFGDKK